jgi:hypothetical protein
LKFGVLGILLYLAMVSSNPLFNGRWTAKKFGATVLDDIWQEVTVFTLFATRTPYLI